ncbi:AMIN-like domain-containing (lipo)protein [Streptomyces wuyuanensis]|uniref:AMIN-like domain-containing (lipo)protein n=1 Tax=Streptomyces wuyuanensis TaxID=1196353 RepID=UPI003D719A23
MRRLWTLGAAVLLAGAGLAASAGEAASVPRRAAPAPPADACSAAWGSGVKSAANGNTQPLKDIRVGQHTCFDRMVFDVTGAKGPVGYHVGYVDAFHQDGSGDRIPVGGGAILQIFVSAPSYDPATMRQVYAGRAGMPLPGVDLTGFRTFRDTKFGASFEGQTQIGLGVRARLPFRVLQYDGKLIVDVAHKW